MTSAFNAGSAPHSPSALTWDLCVATYNRPDMLLRALPLAARQTRPPQSVIVVDGSDGWAETRDRVMAEIAPAFPGVRFVYEQAQKLSTAWQHMRAVELANADVVFVFDDDALMHPDCAERVMEIYEADTALEVAGINALMVREVPQEEGLDDADEGVQREPTRRKPGPFKQWVRGLMRTKDLFVPYDEDFPPGDPPDSLNERFHLGQRPLMVGATLTTRRELVMRERWDCCMMRYAPGEDSDLSYRLSRHGVLLTALDARACHLESPSGRMRDFPRMALSGLNPIFGHRKFSTDLKRSRQRLARLMRRRMAIEALKDIEHGDITFSRARGILFGLRRLDDVFSLPDDRVDEVHEALQKRLLGLG